MRVSFWTGDQKCEAEVCEDDEGIYINELTLDGKPIDDWFLEGEAIEIAVWMARIATANQRYA